MGKYIESDPIALRGGINTYWYADGSPVQKADPRGLFSISGSLGYSGFIATGGGSSSMGIVVGHAGGRPNICIQSVVCIRFGLGLSFTGTAQAGLGSGPLCSGQYPTVGGFGTGAWGTGVGGVANVRGGPGGGSVGFSAMGNLGWGGAAGGEGCLVTLQCFNDPPCCATKSCDRPLDCRDQMGNVTAP